MNLTQEEKRIRIAEACYKKPWLKCYKHSEVEFDRATTNEHGAKLCPWCGSELELMDCPDYFGDLNAMHKAEKELNPDQESGYWEYLLQAHEYIQLWAGTAAAAQRAEAFGRILNLW